MKAIKIIIFGFLIFLVKLLFAFNPKIHCKYDTANQVYYINLANKYYQNQVYDSAIRFNLKALKNTNNNYNPQVSYNLYFNLCKAHLNNHDFDSSLFYAKRSLQLLDKCNELERFWRIMQYEKVNYLLGHLYSIFNEFELSLSYYFNGIAYIDTLSLLDNSYDKKFNLSCYYTNIGHVLTEIGKYNKAIEYYNLSIKQQKELGKYYEFYSSYNYLSIAELLVFKGDFFQALIYYEYLLDLYETQYNKNTTEIGIIYNNIGLVYFNKGNYLKSLNYFNKSTEILEKNLNTSLEIVANIYNNLGDVYRKLGKDKLAKSYFDRVYDIYSILYEENSLQIAFIYNNFANLFKDVGKYDLALKYYKMSLQIRKAIFDTKHDKIAQIYQNIGIIYHNQKCYDSALIYYQKSICANSNGFDDMSINKNPDLSSTSIISKSELLETLTYKAEILLIISKIYSSRRDSLINIALDVYNLAIKISDRLRDDLQDEKSRLHLNSKIHQIYKFSIDHLINYKSKYFEKLFEYLERSKNYELLSSLYKQKAKVISGISEKVLEKEKEYKSLINYYRNKTYQNVNRDSVFTINIEKRLFEVSKEYELFISNIEKNLPTFDSLKFKYNIPKSYEIQDEIDDHQAIISYYYEDTSLFVCVISKDTIVLNKYYSKFSLINTIPEFLKSINLIQFEKFYYYSHILYQTLIEPIKQIINDKNELIIIPYGQLYYVPFETLIYKQKKDVDYTNNFYLINEYSIKYHYSASLWYQEIKDSNTRLIKNDYLYEFTGFAPVFKNDAKNNKIYNSLIKKQIYSARQIENYFTPLPFSVEEVHNICMLFESFGKNANCFLREDATENAFKNNISDSKYIHIATHGLINKKEPTLSGLIFYDYPVKTQNSNPYNFHRIVEYDDGILYFNELFNLDINAELAVIGACESGNGKLENFEGVMSMARGLIYAGVDNIIISLFKVPDKHTKNLMVYFYNKIINGYSFAEALRMAKLHMIKSNNNFPKIWAGFILIGH